MIENFNIETAFGEFLLQEEDYLDFIKNPKGNHLEDSYLKKLKILSNSSQSQCFLWLIEEIDTVGLLVKSEGKVKIKFFDRIMVNGLKLTYERPAKGCGIITIELKIVNKIKIESFAHAFVNVDRLENRAWDYDSWDKKIIYFESEILKKLLEYFDCKTYSKREFSNC